MKKKGDNQDKILDEIRQRVLEESENLKTEKERFLDENVTLEALHEMTDLPMDRIEEITAQVKEKYRQKDGLKKAWTKKNISTIIIFGITLSIIGFIIINFGYQSYMHKQDKDRQKAIYEAQQDYYRLLTTIDSGNLEMVRYHVLEEKIPVELEGFDSNSALMEAVVNAHSDIVSFLLEQEADVLKKNNEGKSVMDLADDGTNIVVKKLISTALVNTTPEESPIRVLLKEGYFYSEKAFLTAIRKKDKKALLLFLAADQGPYSHTYDDKGILAAAEEGDLDLVTLLFAQGKNIDPVVKNRALLNASEEGHIPVIDYLLELGADINFKYDISHYSYEQDFTPLFCAIEGETAALEHLLKKGADPNLIGSAYDLLPIMAPMYTIKESIVTDVRLNQIKILIKYGADVNKKDGNGTTPIEFAMGLRANERRPILRILMDAGAEIPMTEDFFREFIFLNDLPNVKKFLVYGMDPDLQDFEYDDEQTTALIKAVMLRFYEIAKLLIEYKADVNFRTSGEGKTPLLEAVKNEDLNMVKLLLQNDAKVDKAVLERIEEYYNWTGDHTQDTIKALINTHR